MPSVTREQLPSLQISSSHLLTVTFSTYPSQGFSDACGHGCCEMHRLARAAGCITGAMPAPGRAGRADRHGRVRNVGRYPIQRKAQGSLLRTAADIRRSYLGELWIPGARRDRRSPSIKPQLNLPSLCPPNNCPSVGGSPALGGAVSSQGTKACRGFTPHALPSVSSAHKHPSSADGINAAFQCHGRLEAGLLQRRVKGDCSSVRLPLPVSESC